jgi:hypothetical protein
MDMQSGHGHANGHGQAAYVDMDTQYDLGHAAWNRTCSLDIDGYASWTWKCSLTDHGHGLAAWTWTCGMNMDILTP